MMKNAFYFILKALFVLKIFKFLSWLFGHVGKRPDWKDEVNFKIYDVTTWLTNNYNTDDENLCVLAEAYILACWLDVDNISSSL